MVEFLSQLQLGKDCKLVLFKCNIILCQKQIALRIDLLILSSFANISFFITLPTFLCPFSALYLAPRKILSRILFICTWADRSWSRCTVGICKPQLSCAVEKWKLQTALGLRWLCNRQLLFNSLILIFNFFSRRNVTVSYLAGRCAGIRRLKRSGSIRQLRANTIRERISFVFLLRRKTQAINICVEENLGQWQRFGFLHGGLN